MEFCNNKRLPMRSVLFHVLSRESNQTPNPQSKDRMI